MPDEEVIVAPAADAGDAAPPEEPIEQAPPEETPPEETGAPPEETPAEGEGKPPAKPEELTEFTGSVSARLKNLDKQAPGLATHLAKYPQVRDAIAATFRREAAFRELYPGGLAEAQTMRDYFPRGEADVKEMLGDLEEVEGLDKAFYSRDDSGNYPGHAEFIANLAAQDRDATVSLLKRAPAEWAKLDPESYNETMSGIIARTLQNDRVYEHMDILRDLAKELNNPELTNRITALADYLERFQPKRAKEPSDEERRLKADREQLNREKADRSKEEGERFHQTLVGESIRWQRDLINQHQLIKNLPKSIQPEKKGRIVEEVRKRVIAHLQKIRPAMAAFDRAYRARDQKAAMEAQKNYWQPWLLNIYTRKVLAEETPGLVATRPGAAKPAVKPGVKSAPVGAKKPYQGADKRWYKGDGTPFTTQEVLRGAHLQ